MHTFLSTNDTNFAKIRLKKIFFKKNNDTLDFFIFLFFYYFLLLEDCLEPLSVNI